MQTRPPSGSAISGSTEILASGRRARSTITVSGPANACRAFGSFSAGAASRSFCEMPSPAFFARREARTMVAMSAQSAGIRFFIITAVRSSLKASVTAMVFGFGETMLPALPPPIIASRMPLFERPARSPIARAIGATVMTAMSMNTPTAQIIMVATASAAMARFSPIVSTMVSAIFCAAPVLISAPARIPLVRIRSTEDIMEPAPLTIVETVPARPPPPINPPIKAPRIRP